jgi:ketosteroid isomerase-like protein
VAAGGSPDPAEVPGSRSRRTLGSAPGREQEVTVSDIEGRHGFDEDEIRAAERALELSLAAADPTAWVFDYTEDAVFDAGGHSVQGREALLEMANGMSPLSEVSIRPLRTEGSAGLATVWCEASWVSGPPDDRSRTEVRGIIVWRNESDGRWRVVLEHIS